MKTDPRIDAYIAKAPEFARPILERLRAAFHAGGPGLRETVKWNMPYFEGNGLVGGMAAFKQHVSLGFWRGKELSDPEGLFRGVGASEMCALKVASLAELPSKKVLVSYVKQAVALDAVGADAKPKAVARAAPQAPADLLAALKRDRKALAAFEAFAPGYKREYVEWITAAKRAETRAKRVVQAVEWLAEGKSRNWRHMKR